MNSAVRFVNEGDEVKMEEAILPTRIRKRPTGKAVLEAVADVLVLALLCCVW